MAELRPVMHGPEGPSPAGRTWAVAIAVPFSVAPGASVER
jgi:hypothetical protein